VRGERVMSAGLPITIAGVFLAFSSVFGYEERINSLVQSMSGNIEEIVLRANANMNLVRLVAFILVVFVGLIFGFKTYFTMIVIFIAY
jgi:type IV secretory pathway VirB2 component (pilin)